MHVARQGEFEQVALPHSPALLRVARRLTGKASSAEDLVQETLLAAWRGFHQFRPDSNIRAWLFRILFNTFYGQGRKRSALLVPLSPALPARLPDSDDVIEVGRALEALEVDHRSVLMLGVVEGFTCREMSDILNVPIGTIMSRLSRARLAMRKTLEKPLVKNLTDEEISEERRQHELLRSPGSPASVAR